MLLLLPYHKTLLSLLPHRTLNYLAVPKGYAYSLFDPDSGKVQTYWQLLDGKNADKWYQGCSKEMG
jgi:hypothetical protein